MASATCCDAGAPVTAEYDRKGTIVKMENVDVYTVGSGNRAIIVIYDIFGFEFPQVFQVCDRLAAAGCVVAAPDVFHGKPWPMSKMPPKPEDNIMDWMSTEGSWSKVKLDVMKCVGFLRVRHGVKSFGCAGFCWGASIAFQAGQDPLFSAIAGCHPSLMQQDKALAEALQCPAAVLATEGDPLETVKEVLDTKPFASKCFYKRYADQAHGFMAARGDWEKPEVAAAATDGIKHLTQFFGANLGM